MDIRELVHALLKGDLLTARQFVADAQRAKVAWRELDAPRDLSDVEMAVAAGVIEMLAARSGSTPPPWTLAVGAVREQLILDPGLEQMPRSFAHAEAAGPEPLRKRNMVALPDFLDVA
jgi:hypothetical protein